MILIGNGKVITRDNANPFIENGAVCVEDTKIKEIGKCEDLLKKYPEAEYLDAKGGVIMPGFINTHHHIYSAMARGLTIQNHNPENFKDILEGLWWRLDRKLSLEQTSLCAYTTYLDCIKNGVTTVFDHHASYGSIKDSLFAISDAAKDLGMRTCLCYEISDRDGKQKMQEAVAENFNFLNYTDKQKDDMQKAMIGLHASFTLSDSTLDYIAEKKPSSIGYHVHVAEGIDDVNDSLANYGKPVVARLEDRGVLGDKTIAVHCIHINQEEMDLLKESDTMVVHNPESNMGNAVGCPKILDIYNKGILVGLGTDGYTSDMLESMKVANILHKHDTKNPNVAWGEIPQMLFYNNREIANRYFDTPVGILKAGAAADIIISDYLPLTPMNADNINSHILFGMNGRSVVTTMINGLFLMKNRKFTIVDEEKILYDSRKEASKLWDSINKGK